MFGFLRDWPKLASLKTRPGPANGTLQSLQRGDRGTYRMTRRVGYGHELDISSARERGCCCATSHAHGFFGCGYDQGVPLAIDVAGQTPARPDKPELGSDRTRCRKASNAD
jgi:hypothetical protein